MRDIILSQADQIIRSLEVNKDVRVPGQFDEIILAGMGGSGHPGDLLNALALTAVPLTVHRSYDLPRPLPAGRQGYGATPLVIVSTYSGNTEESLSAYSAAQKNGYARLANTAGGKLAEWAKRDHVPLAKIDFPGMQPRHTLLASFTGLYVALRNSALALDITDDLLKAADFLQRMIPTLEAPAKELAEQLKGTIPVYTSSDRLSFAAKNFKIQTNENTKVPAFWNEFPELNHNEMVGFSGLRQGFGAHSRVAPFSVVMLRDRDDHPRIQARMDVTAELYKQWGVATTVVDIAGKTLLEKILYAVMFGLWTTYFLADAYGIDPVPVAGVENFKKKLIDVAGEP